MTTTPAAASSGDGPPISNVSPSGGGSDFPRSVQSDGVSKSGRPREVETTRQHLRLALENWEKQYADVLRYERAQVLDDANKAAFRRALTRSGAALGVALSALVPVATNSADLQRIGDGPSTVGNGLALLGGLSLATCGASIWWAGYLGCHATPLQESADEATSSTRAIGRTTASCDCRVLGRRALLQRARRRSRTRVRVEAGRNIASNRVGRSDNSKRRELDPIAVSAVVLQQDHPWRVCTCSSQQAAVPALEQAGVAPGAGGDLLGPSRRGILLNHFPVAPFRRDGNSAPEKIACDMPASASCGR